MLVRLLQSSFRSECIVLPKCGGAEVHKHLKRDQPYAYRTGLSASFSGIRMKPVECWDVPYVRLRPGLTSVVPGVLVVVARRVPKIAEKWKEGSVRLQVTWRRWGSRRLVLSAARDLRHFFGCVSDRGLCSSQHGWSQRSVCTARVGMAHPKGPSSSPSVYGAGSAFVVCRSSYFGLQ